MGQKGKYFLSSLTIYSTGHTAGYEWAVEYPYLKGEISVLSLDEAGMVIRHIRIANLPPEVPERTLRVAITQ